MSGAGSALCRAKASFKMLCQLGTVRRIKKPPKGSGWVKPAFEGYMQRVEGYIGSLEREGLQQRFSASCREESVYAAAFLPLLCHLTGYSLSASTAADLKSTLLGSQQGDGLCYDWSSLSLRYLNGDGWGARHIMPIWLSALWVLGEAPPHRLAYLDFLCRDGAMQRFLDSLNWREPWSASNTVMNLGTALQYRRDFFGDSDAAAAVRELVALLLERSDPKSGMWHRGELGDAAARYRAVRGAYHIYPILMYDGVMPPFSERAVEIILGLQNSRGGFDLRWNSSACEDIDAVDPLIRLSLARSDIWRSRVEPAVEKALFWVLQNQRPDGGCVFRLGESFCYGSESCSAGAGESSLFATWFRTLSVVLMYDYLTGCRHPMLPLPGYHLPLQSGDGSIKPVGGAR